MAARKKLEKKPKNKGLQYERIVQRSIASGSVWFDPLDLKYKDYVIECKFTEKKGYRITLDLVEKIFDKALDVGKEPFLVIGLKRNEHQIFNIQCRITLENKKV